MIVIAEIQKRLAEAIKTSGLKQKQIANEIGISQQNISHYVKGDKMPSIDTFANLCKALDLDANYILGITDI